MSREWKDVAKSVENGDKIISDTVSEYTREINEAMKVNYRRVSEIYFERTLEDLENAKSAEQKDTENIFWDTMNKWIATEAAREVVMVNSTTRKILNSIIKRGIEDGLGDPEIAKNIRTLSPISNKVRANRIARTETHTAYSKATNETIRSTTTRIRNKVWVSAGDERVRIDHAVASGQSVGMDEFFFVGNEHLEFPGDSRGSAGNIINCRCIVNYITVRQFRNFYLLPTLLRSL